MAWANGKKYSLLKLALTLSVFASEPIRSSAALFLWCPSDVFACTCSATHVDRATSSGYRRVLISCETTDVTAIIRNISGNAFRELELHVAPGDEDGILSSLAFLDFSSELFYLDLSGNSLRQIEDGALHNAEDLLRLNLSHNFLSALGEGMFSGSMNSSDVIIQYGLPNLKELLLDNNDIAFIEDGVFADLMDLRFLDISSNRIAEIGNFTFLGLHGLTTLRLAGNFIEYINASMWAPLNKVEEINLSNNHIGDVAPDSFTNLPNLRALRLDRNRIEDIPLPGLQIPSVNHLNLSHNSISFVSHEFFHMLSRNITTLNLDNNFITMIAYGFSPSVILEELYLNNNDLGNINHGFLWGIQNVQRLEMKNNRIQVIANYMLGDLPYLKTLILDNNEMSYLSIETFDVEYDPRQRFQKMPPMNIEKLSLNNNRLSYPCTDVLEQMGWMHTYSMHDNTILQLRPFDFPNHQALANIDLSMNRIYSIAPDSFANLPSLYKVNLRGNRIQTLSRDVFDVLPAFLILGSNPLTCDCHLAWFAESPTPSEDDAQCAVPRALESRKLSSLNVTEFHCSIEANTNMSSEFSSTHGEGILLQCPVTSASQVSVKWFTSAFNHTSKSMVLEEVNPLGDSSTLITNFPNGSLYIHTVTHEGNANYTCRATNNIDQREFLILLRVEDSNGTNPDGTEGGSEGKMWMSIMTYVLGGAAGAVFLIGFISVLLAFFLSNRRSEKKETNDSFEKELPINNKEYE